MVLEDKNKIVVQQDNIVPELSENLNDQLASLSKEEKEAVLAILKEYAANGNSQTLNQLENADWEEIPVDIDEFLDNDDYLGKSIWEVDKATGEKRCTLFSFWRATLHKLFPTNTKTAYNTLILTGCLGYNTEIPLLNGNIAKIGDLAKKAAQYKLTNLYVYSFDLDTNRYVPGRLINAFSTGIKDVYKITLDNGKSFEATSNHKFLTRDKHWKSIDTGLKVNDSLMPYYVEYKPIYTRPNGKSSSDYQVIKHPQKDGTYIEEPTHRMVMRYKLGKFKGVIHHKDYNRLNNNPDNLQVMNWLQHRKFHARRGGEQWKIFNKKRRNGEISNELEQRILDGGLKENKNRWADPEQHILASKRTTERMKNGFAKEMVAVVWNSENKEKNKLKVAQNIIKANKNNVDKYQISKATKIANLALRDFGELTEKTYQEIKFKYNLRTGYPAFKSILKRLSYEELLQRAQNYNHTIIKIEYLGKQEVFDLTVEKYHNFAINEGIVAHNSIGIGKTLMACVSQLYLLYRMLCLKDPYAYYGLMPMDKITFSMLNVNLETAKGVGWQKIQSMVQMSPWFLEHGTLNASRVDPQWQPGKHIELIFGSSNNHVVGRALFSNFSDELNFTGTNIEKQKKKLLKLIAQIDARLKSRFAKGTFVPTLNILASSADVENAFLNDYINRKQKAESSTTLVINEPQWVVRDDKGTPDDPGAFYVAVGGKTLAHELLPVGASEIEVDKFRAKGYKMVKIPPVFREDFETNLDQALMDIAGLSSTVATKFISGARLNEIKSNLYQNPFSKDIIEVGNSPNDYLQYANFFDLSKVNPQDMSRPLFIHLDMSLSGDKTGIAGVWIMGKKPTKEGEDPSKEMYYKLAFSVAVKAPKGYQVSFEKNRNFIRWLRTQGFAIKGISSDTFQSANLHQELKSDGFKTEIISVDRVNSDHICPPYQYLKSTIYEHKLVIYSKCDLLTDELIGLERTSTGKIDHTPDSINSKDTADALCGSIWLASKYAEEYAYNYGENLDASIEATMLGVSDISRKSEMIANFQEELTRAYQNTFKELDETDYEERKKKKEENDYYKNLIDGIIVL